MSFGTELGESSTGNVLILVVIAALAYWIWKRSDNLATDLFASALMYVASLSGLAFLGDHPVFTIIGIVFGLFASFILLYSVMVYIKKRGIEQSEKEKRAEGLANEG